MKFYFKNDNMVDSDNDDESTNTDLISVERNKVMFYSDVTPESCFKLISCINKAKEYVAVQNALSEFDEYNNCVAEFSNNCNDLLYDLDSLKVYVQSGSSDYEFFTITDTNESVIIINENFNNSLTIPVIVRDYEEILGNFYDDYYKKVTG